MKSAEALRERAKTLRQDTYSSSELLYMDGTVDLDRVNELMAEFAQSELLSALAEMTRKLEQKTAGLRVITEQAVRYRDEREALKAELEEAQRALRQSNNALRNLIKESEYNRTGLLPTPEQLDKSQAWWLTNATELASWDRAALHKETTND